jgi:hypothetical protein
MQSLRALLMAGMLVGPPCDCRLEQLMFPDGRRPTWVVSIRQGNGEWKKQPLPVPASFDEAMKVCKKLCVKARPPKHALQTPKTR